MAAFNEHVNRDWLLRVRGDANGSLSILLTALHDHYDEILVQGSLHGVTVPSDMPEAFRAMMYKFKGRVFPPLPPANWEDMQLLAMLKVALEREDRLSWLLTGLNAYLY